MDKGIKISTKGKVHPIYGRKKSKELRTVKLIMTDTGGLIQLFNKSVNKRYIARLELQIFIPQ
jgi:hypothetical protein